MVCLDRTDDIGRKTDRQTPVVGAEAVRSLVTEVGLADPEGSAVNSLLEALRVARDLEADGSEALVGVVSGGRETVVGADRAVARQLDDLLAEHDIDSAVVVIDSAQDERLVPIIESRVRVDSVDRVVVRQARDLESTYYLLKQFLADEELRQTTLVPLGVALLVLPLLLAAASTAVAVATITAVIGMFLLYKGLGVDEHAEDVPGQVQEALYSGQVSIVTYVVAAGLSLIGLFAGALGVSGLSGSEGVLIPAMQFAYDSVAWMAMAALAASAGRLLDEFIREERLRTPYLNLPFVVVAIGLVVRGFSAYFLDRAGVLEPMMTPALRIGSLTRDPIALPAASRLALFIVVGLLISVVGIRVATYFSDVVVEEEVVEEEFVE